MDMYEWFFDHWAMLGNLSTLGLLPSWVIPVASLSGVISGLFFWYVSGEGDTSSKLKDSFERPRHHSNNQWHSIGNWGLRLSVPCAILMLIWIIVPFLPYYETKQLQGLTSFGREPVIFPIRLLIVGSMILLLFLLGVWFLLVKDRWDKAKKESEPIGDVLNGKQPVGGQNE